jgi:hypothetical protein
VTRERGFRKDFRRERRARRPLPTVLVVCEGAKTEPGYFTAFCQAHGIHAHVRVCGEECGSHPKSVVDYAAKEMRRAKRDRNPFERTWCVFDRDAHEEFSAALDRARSLKIGVALSNPCFELWYLLHLAPYSTGYIDRDDAQAKVGEFIAGYHKSMRVFDRLPDRARALEDAARLRRHHQAANGTGFENPSTSVDLLVLELTALATRQPAG